MFFRIFLYFLNPPVFPIFSYNLDIFPIFSSKNAAGICRTFEPIVVGKHVKEYLANSADPDQTPQNAASDQGLHCLQIV